MNGGRFDFDDGGTYCGGWEDGKAHGHGVCTGPKGQGEYSGAWHYGFEVSGVYTWPSGNTYEGQWQNGKRHGLGVERRGRWVYRGEWTQGYKGRYGARQSASSQAKYEGTWSSGLQDGYGMETYADGGTYQGQWLRGMRHGYGIRKSAPFGVAAKYRSRSHAHASLTSLRSEQGEEPHPPAHPPAHHDKDKSKSYGDESRGGFVLRAKSEAATRRRSLSERSIAMRAKILRPFHITKQRSTGDIHQRVSTAAGATGSLRSSGSTVSCTSDESGYAGHDQTTVPEELVDSQTTESYLGEWKNDKRSGFGVGERSDGLKYEGEWFNNKKFGYGVTTLKDGTREEGKYKNNILVTSQRKRHLLFVRSSKLRERIDAATSAANRAAQIALQKADIGVSRTATARDRADQGDYAAVQAKEDSDLARIHAKQFDPSFLQPGTKALKQQRHDQSNQVVYQPNQVPLVETPPQKARSVAEPPSHLAPPERIVEVEVITPPMQTPPSELSPTAFVPSAPSSDIAGPSANYYPLSPEIETVSLENKPSTSAAVIVDLPPIKAAGSIERLANYTGPPRPNTLSTPDTPSPTIVATPPAPKPQVAFKDGIPSGTGDTSSASISPSNSSSRQSITNIVNDHFDQYTMAANPAAAKLYQANLVRHRQQHTPEPETPEAEEREEEHYAASGGGGIIRRSTLASSRDYKGIPGPRRVAVEAPSGGLAESTEEGETKQSLPDLTDLNRTSLHLTREQASRLSSQRRQERHRLAEEEELMQTNPLRYLFHPAVRAWFGRWKFPLLVLLVNLCLSLIFYQLLTYNKNVEEDSSNR